MLSRICLAAIAALALVSSAGADGYPQIQPDFVLRPAPPPPPEDCANTKVTLQSGATACGYVETTNGTAVRVYLGMRYAAAQRWHKPAAFAYKPDEHVSANLAGNMCPQPDPMKNSLYLGAEDCLFANVWSPKGANGNTPVMVFFHGGGFVNGAGSLPLFEGSQLVSQGVIVVTVNYRLGALGFLVADWLRSGKIGGNFGLMDQQEALRWVQANIGAFGGDKKKVTIFGESAGAQAVALHDFDMPSSRDLFAASIIESNPAGVIYRPQARSKAQGALYLSYLCKQYRRKAGTRSCWLDPNWLSDVSLDLIVPAQSAFAPKAGSKAYLIDLLLGVFGTQNTMWAPVVDGDLVRGEPYAGYQPGTKAKPLAFGTNLDEGTIFLGAFYNPKLFTKPVFSLAMAKFGFLGFKIPKIDRYNPNKQTVPADSAYENKYSRALMNVMTDYVFTCGGMASLRNGSTTPNGGAPAYTYQFTQLPYFDIYNLFGLTPPPDKGACAADADNVCHANELPYVFNNLTVVGLPKPSDIALGAAMMPAWAAFAKSPASQGNAWTPYTEGETGMATAWNGNTLPPGTVALDKFASCSKIWLHAKPYH